MSDYYRWSSVDGPTRVHVRREPFKSLMLCGKWYPSWSKRLPTEGVPLCKTCERALRAFREAIG